MSYYKQLNRFREWQQLNANAPNRENIPCKTEPYECPVCLDTVVSIIKLKCEHMFCADCIHKIINNETIKCPMCRAEQSIHVGLTTEQQQSLMKNLFIEVHCAWDAIKDERCNMLSMPFVYNKLCGRVGAKKIQCHMSYHLAERQEIIWLHISRILGTSFLAN
jgi:hypothetical protein